MNFHELARVDSQKTVVKAPEYRVSDSNALDDILAERRKKAEQKQEERKRISDAQLEENKKRHFHQKIQKISDFTKDDVKSFFGKSRIERRKFLARLSDSARNKFLTMLHKIKDAANYWEELSDNITNWIVDLNDEAHDKLVEQAKSTELTADQKAALLKIIDMESVPSEDVSEVYGPLKNKFQELGITVPPFAILQDSVQDLLDEVEPKIADSEKINDKSEADKVVDTDEEKHTAAELGDDDPDLAEERKREEEGEKSAEADSADDVVDLTKGDDNSDELAKDDNSDELAKDDEDVVDLTKGDENSEESTSSSEETHKPTLSETIEAVEAFKAYMDNGDKEPLKKLLDAKKYVPKAFTRVQDAFDDDGRFVLSKEDYDHIIEEFKDELKEKGVTVPEDSYQYETFPFDKFKLSDGKGKPDTMIPLTNQEYHALTDHQLYNQTIRVARLMDDKHIVPYGKKLISYNNVITDSSKISQVWLTDKPLPQKISQKWVKDNAVSADAFSRAALLLGNYTLLSPVMYKKHVSDDACMGYTTCADIPAVAGSYCSQEDVNTCCEACKQLTPQNKVVITISADKPEESGIITVPLKDSAGWLSVKSV